MSRFILVAQSALNTEFITAAAGAHNSAHCVASFFSIEVGREFQFPWLLLQVIYCCLHETKLASPGRITDFSTLSVFTRDPLTIPSILSRSCARLCPAVSSVWHCLNYWKTSWPDMHNCLRSCRFRFLSRRSARAELYLVSTKSWSPRRLQIFSRARAIFSQLRKEPLPACSGAIAIRGARSFSWPTCSCRRCTTSWRSRSSSGTSRRAPRRPRRRPSSPRSSRWRRPRSVSDYKLPEWAFIRRGLLKYCKFPEQSALKPYMNKWPVNTPRCRFLFVASHARLFTSFANGFFTSWQTTKNSNLTM